MSEKILLVDDEDANLRLLTQWLIPLGYEVELAANGEEAVHKARQSRPGPDSYTHLTQQTNRDVKSSSAAGPYSKNHRACVQDYAQPR